MFLGIMNIINYSVTGTKYTLFCLHIPYVAIQSKQIYKFNKKQPARASSSTLMLIFL